MQLRPSRHSGTSNENHVLLNVVTSCLPKGAWPSWVWGGGEGGGWTCLSSMMALPPAPRRGCQHSMSRGAWQQQKSPSLLPHSASPQHFLSHVQQWEFHHMFSKQAKIMGSCVSFNLQSGNSSKDTLAFVPTQAFPSTLPAQPAPHTFGRINLLKVGKREFVCNIRSRSEETSFWLLFCMLKIWEAEDTHAADLHHSCHHQILFGWFGL